MIQTHRSKKNKKTPKKTTQNKNPIYYDKTQGANFQGSPLSDFRVKMSLVHQVQTTTAATATTPKFNLFIQLPLQSRRD